MPFFKHDDFRVSLTWHSASFKPFFVIDLLPANELGRYEALLQITPHSIETLAWPRDLAPRYQATQLFIQHGS